MYTIPFLDLPPLRAALGSVTLPGSKSISNRILLMAALAEGRTEIHGLLDADDTQVMLASLRSVPCAASAPAASPKDGAASTGGVVASRAALLERWMDAGHLPRRDPQHLLFLIWATTQHYADFAAQVKALTGQGLDDPRFFAEARRAVLLAVLGRS